MMNVFEFKMNLWYEIAKINMNFGTHSVEEVIEICNKAVDAFDAKFAYPEDKE